MEFFLTVIDKRSNNHHCRMRFLRVLSVNQVIYAFLIPAESPYKGDFQAYFSFLRENGEDF